MLQVSQSSTGQFVVTHLPSNTVMVGDDLVATYEQMRGFVAGLGPVAHAPAAAPPARAGLGSSATHWVLLAALALLPFVWLGALHVSLGRLVSELRVAPPAADLPTPNVDLRARVERLERQVETLIHPDARPAEGAPESDAELQAEKDPPEPGAPADAAAPDGKAADAKAPEVKAPDARAVPDEKKLPKKSGFKMPRPNGAAGPG